jgi:hypothetical protein
MKYKLIVFAVFILLSCSSNAQRTNAELQHGRIIDQLFEIGVPALLIMVVLYTITQLVKVRADKKIRESMIGKGISDETIVFLAKNANKRLRLEYLKWGLIAGYTSVAFLLSEFITFGFITFALVFAAVAAALLTLYLLSKKEI